MPLVRICISRLWAVMAHYKKLWNAGAVQKGNKKRKKRIKEKKRKVKIRLDEVESNIWH